MSMVKNTCKSTSTTAERHSAADVLKLITGVDHTDPEVVRQQSREFLNYARVALGASSNSFFNRTTPPDEWLANLHFELAKIMFPEIEEPTVEFCAGLWAMRYHFSAMPQLMNYLSPFFKHFSMEFIQALMPASGHLKDQLDARRRMHHTSNRDPNVDKFHFYIDSMSESSREFINLCVLQQVTCSTGTGTEAMVANMIMQLGNRDFSAKFYDDSVEIHMGEQSMKMTYPVHKSPEEK